MGYIGSSSTYMNIRINIHSKTLLAYNYVNYRELNPGRPHTERAIYHLSYRDRQSSRWNLFRCWLLFIVVSLYNDSYVPFIFFTLCYWCLCYCCLLLVSMLLLSMLLLSVIVVCVIVVCYCCLCYCCLLLLSLVFVTFYSVDRWQLCYSIILSFIIHLYWISVDR